MVAHPRVTSSAETRTVDAVGNLGRDERPAFFSVPASIKYQPEPTWDCDGTEIVHELMHRRVPAPIRVFRHSGRDDAYTP